MTDMTLMKRAMRVFIPPARDTTHGMVADRLLLPDGPRQGKPYRWRDDPVHACLIGQLDLDRWDSFACPGAVQTGKSLALILVPSLRQLIFQRRAVVYAQPSQQKLHEAWTGKVSPAISGAGLGGWLPTEGQGARGGQTPRFVVFRDPDTLARAGMLYLIHGGGKNEGAQAAVSAPTVLVDEAGSFQSTHRIALIGKRADSFGAQAKRVYTSTVKKDGDMDDDDACIMLSLYQDSTRSRLYFACPHCGHWHPMEWENVRYEPDDEAEAADTVRMLCPKCERTISEEQRQKMLRDWRLVHKGQTVSDDGRVLGAEPRTRRFGLLWTALDSTLRDLPTLAIEHWRATQDMDRGNHGLMRSFWRDQLCRPYRADLDTEEDGQTLVPTRNRLAALSEASTLAVEVDVKEEDGDSWHFTGMPQWAESLTIGCDVQAGGDRAPPRLYFVAYARGGARGAIVGYGTMICCPPGRQATEPELHAALDRLKQLLADWGPSVPIVSRGVDTGDQADEILRWLRVNRDWKALKGTGPLKINDRNDRAGWAYVRKQDRYTLYLVETKAVTKTIQGEILARDGEGSCILPHGLDSRAALIRHICASVEYFPGKWSERPSDRKHHPEWQKRNDYADALAYARALAYLWETRAVAPRRKYGLIGTVGG